ncbi:MAG TPA: RagB/SusD family nutrient uptake outer membrane protein [Longimicrobiales bacterium]|nr:RagB/SusD family nutrient uptake outer membrane protein [Longimicrobiales bacterium]
MVKEEKTARRIPARRGMITVAAVMIMSTMTACDGLLDVEMPGAVAEEDLNNPALAVPLFNSGLGSFECAYGNYVATVGVLTEEYIVSSGWLNDNIWGWRGIETRSAPGTCSNNRNASGFGAYTPLHEARYIIESTIDRIGAFDVTAVPSRDQMIATLYAYAGYTYTLLGEGFCEMAIDQGPLMQPIEVLQAAEAHFTEAITRSGPSMDDDIRLLALLGRARVRLDLGNNAGAATDAAQIPAGWRYVADYSTLQGNRENRVYNVTVRNSFLSVAPAYRDLTVAGEPDPRVPVANTGAFGHDGTTEQWRQLKYPTADAPIAIASWEEARLIVAEALGGAEAINAINELRAAQGIAPLDNPDAGNMLPVILEERRRQLFSEGHRLNDMLRHDIPFPTGTNHKGQTYGPTTCLYLPDQERNNNPNL